MKRGWIRLWRQTFDRDDWMRPTKRHPAGKIEAWMDIISMTQYESYDHHGHRLQRGEVMLSLEASAKRWCWHKSRVRRFLQWLKTDTMIDTIRDTPLGTIYRVVNYDTYNPLDASSDTPPDTASDTIPTPFRHHKKKEALRNLPMEGDSPASKNGPKPKKPSTRKHRIPDDWKPTDSHREKARAERVNLEREAERFRNHHEAKGTTYIDWSKAFHNWLLSPYADRSSLSAVGETSAEEQAREAERLERVRSRATKVHEADVERLKREGEEAQRELAEAKTWLQAQPGDVQARANAYSASQLRQLGFHDPNRAPLALVQSAILEAVKRARIPEEQTNAAT